MESLQINVSDIVGKWSAHHSSSTPLKNPVFLTASPDTGIDYSRIQRRRNIASRRGQKRDKNVIIFYKSILFFLRFIYKFMIY